MPFDRQVTVILDALDRIDKAPSRTFTLTPDNPTLIIGRSARKCSGAGSAPDDMYFDSTVISRLHAQFQMVGPDALYLVDLGSTHGTWVGDVRLKQDVPHHCTHGAVVTFGNPVTHANARSFKLSCAWRFWSMPESKPAFLNTTFAVPDESSEEEADCEADVSCSRMGNVTHRRLVFGSQAPQTSTDDENYAAPPTPCPDDAISSSCAGFSSQAAVSAGEEPTGGYDAPIDAQIHRLSVSQRNEPLYEAYGAARRVGLDSDLSKLKEETVRPLVTGNARAIEAGMRSCSTERLRSVNLSSQRGETDREAEKDSPNNQPLSDDAPAIDGGNDDLKERPVAAEDDKLEKHPALSISHVLITSTERQISAGTSSTDTERSVYDILSSVRARAPPTDPGVTSVRKADASGDAAHEARNPDGNGKSTSEDVTEKAGSALASSDNTCHRVFEGAEVADTARDYNRPAVAAYPYAAGQLTSGKSVELPDSSGFSRNSDEHLEQRATQQSPTLSFVGVDDVQARQYNSATAQWSPVESMADDSPFALPKSWEPGQSRFPHYSPRISTLPPIPLADRAVEGTEEHTTQAPRDSSHEGESMTSPSSASMGDPESRTSYSSGSLAQRDQCDTRFEQSPSPPSPLASCLGKRKHSEETESSSTHGEQEESSQGSGEVCQDDELPDAQATDSLPSSEPVSLNSFHMSQEQPDKSVLSDRSPAPKRPRVARSSDYFTMVKSAARVLTGAAFAGAGVFAYLAASNPDPI